MNMDSGYTGNTLYVLRMLHRKDLDTDGGLWYEYDAAHKKLIKEKHWWPQAEAMIGFLNAWQITGYNSDLQKSVAGMAALHKTIFWIKKTANGFGVWMKL